MISTERVLVIAVGNKVPGDPPEALASWQGGVVIAVGNKVPGDPPEALASWQGGVLINERRGRRSNCRC